MQRGKTFADAADSEKQIDGLWAVGMVRLVVFELDEKTVIELLPIAELPGQHAFAQLWLDAGESGVQAAEVFVRSGNHVAYYAHCIGFVYALCIGCA